MNLPNTLTLIRIALCPVFMAFLMADGVRSLYVALVVFLIAAVTDVYDGRLARKTGDVTSFGEFMDPVADKLLVSMALVGFLAREIPGVPGWMVVVIIARELVITGFRSLAAYRGLIIPSSRMARVKTVFQMSLVVWILAGVLFVGRFGVSGDLNANLVDSLHGAILHVLLWSTVVLTTLSGLDYVLRNRSVLLNALR